MSDSKLFTAAYRLASAMNKVADDNLPKRLAGHVKTHAGIAVGSAFIPIPGADVVAAGANIWAMYGRINKELELPFGENVIKSLAAGIATNLGTYVVGAAVISGALKFFPGLGTVGGAAVMSATLYGLTVAAGIIYMKALTRLTGADAQQLNADGLQAAVNEILDDKEAIRAMIDDAKSSYKEEKRSGAVSAA